MNFKRAIKIRMAKLDINQTELASRAGISTLHISCILTGKRSFTMKSISKIAAVFGIKGWELWKEAEEEV